MLSILYANNNSQDKESTSPNANSAKTEKCGDTKQQKPLSGQKARLSGQHAELAPLDCVQSLSLIPSHSHRLMLQTQASANAKSKSGKSFLTCCLLRQGLLSPRWALNFLCPWGWSWSPHLPALPGMLGLQTCATRPSCACQARVLPNELYPPLPQFSIVN